MIIRFINAAINMLQILISMVSVSAGSSTHTYTRGSFTHQLNKELDNIRNQRNKLGKYLYYVTGLIYFVVRP